MIYTAIKILAVNMYCSNVATHSLLQTSNADILLIQEPWYGHVQVVWSDSDPSVDMVNGIAHNPCWESFLPPHSSSDTCKVSAYVRTGLACSATVVNNLTHPLASASSMVLDFHHDEEQIHLVNVYHLHPERGHALHHILSSTLDPLIPTAVFGDFNTHSPLWSVPNATPSAWASCLVDWFIDQGLDLLNEPGWVTWNGRDDQLASVLDLAFLNEAAMASDQFFLYSVLFAESVGSDHATSLLTWHSETSLALVPPPTPVGFVINDLAKDAWIKKFHLEPCPDTVKRWKQKPRLWKQGFKGQGSSGPQTALSGTAAPAADNAVASSSRRQLTPALQGPGKRKRAQGRQVSCALSVLSQISEEFWPPPE